MWARQIKYNSAKLFSSPFVLTIKKKDELELITMEIWRTHGKTGQLTLKMKISCSVHDAHSILNTNFILLFKTNNLWTVQINLPHYIHQAWPRKPGSTRTVYFCVVLSENHIYKKMCIVSIEYLSIF